MYNIFMSQDKIYYIYVARHNTMIAEAAKPSAEESSRVQELQAKLASVSAKLAGKVGQHLCVCVCVCVCVCAHR